MPKIPVVIARLEAQNERRRSYETQIQPLRLPLTDYKTGLQQILTLLDPSKIEDQLKSTTQFISEKDLAHFFIDCIYLKNVVQLIIDEHWIQSKQAEDEIQFDRFIKKFLKAELKPLLYLHAYFSKSNIEKMNQALQKLTQAEAFLLKTIQPQSPEFQKTVLQISLQLMSELFELEHQQNLKPNVEGTAQLSLYRTFDILDQVFDLKYLLNETPSIDQKERLYEGAGVGVQSSYATTLLALRYLNLSKGSRFIDLGSGYGRIGFVVGLLRPDIQFTGYEFVKDRVDIANKISARLLMDKHVHFVTQDLSIPEFKIPVAETYYIFDSFTDETYATIMEQLQQISLHKKIIVVTKGNAKLWMKRNFWSAPQEFNGGNLCFFRSTSNPQ